MTTFIYPSAISSEVYGTESTAVTSQSQDQDVHSQNRVPATAKTGGFAAFVCHVAQLEAHLLRGGKTKFFQTNFEVAPGSRHPIGNGASFSVDRAELSRRNGSAKDDDLPLSMKYVAIKTVRERPTNTLRWRGILFEIRTLLHEPLRYHPNVVRLLEIGWDASETGSAFPALYLEFAEFGTMETVQQKRSSPLPFRIKQKLCYDVGRGLSILHACGIVHGDLKHENVLIFRNQYQLPPDQPYTAKLADFGGAVIDTTHTDQYILPMGTVPFEAPEANQSLTAQGIKMTDVYSFGMLVWRCFLDCADMLVPMGIRKVGDYAKLTDAEHERVKVLKESDEIHVLAWESVIDYRESHSLPQVISPMVRSVLGSTLRRDPTKRSLDKAQALLRGISFNAVSDYLSVKDLANEKRDLAERNSTPGHHGIDVDSLGYHLGRLGDDYDAQNNLPGYRSRLAHPSNEGFLFEPLKLKSILGWTQQSDIVKELETLARAPQTNSTVELPPFTASFFLFQAHLAGFGTDLKVFKACEWLYKASMPPEEVAEVDYLATAWLSRVCAAFSVPDPRPTNDQIDGLFWSIVRGHRHSVEDAYRVLSTLESESDKVEARKKIHNAMWFLRTMSGGVGMPHYAPRKLRRDYDLQDLIKLDGAIKLELGENFEACLRTHDSAEKGASKLDGSKPDDDKNLFDKIYVNHKGHGLLHMAATLGELPALSHLYKKYNCNIDLSNQSIDESPLVCACRSGHYECAKFLLDNGANPDGTEFGQEAPLHWLSSFQEEEMVPITQLLLQKGARRERLTKSMRKDVRQILSDWEDTFSIPVTPLGRAVLLQNLDAVKVLLSVADADPTFAIAEDNSGVTSAVEIASVLSLPAVLDALLTKVDEKRARDPNYHPHIYDECEMLEAAHDMRHTRSYDPLALQSRVIRCGVNYKGWLSRTLQELHLRRQRDPKSISPSDVTIAPKVLCLEVSLGNYDIVETLLDLGHDPNGSGGHRPLEAAVLTNNAEIFALLNRRGATLSSELAGTLLVLLASRTQTSPTGTRIAEDLIAAGAEIEPSSFHDPSALVMAVKNRFFDLADLFINYGASASINRCYQWSVDDEPVTLLGYLLQHHTYSSLQSIDYLVQKHKADSSAVCLGPCISDASGLTALHAIAVSSSRLWTNFAQVSARILSSMLDLFPDASSLGSYAVHPRHGTPLTAAVLFTNEPVISALLDSDHRGDLSATVMLPLFYPVGDQEATVLRASPIQLVYYKILEAVADVQAYDHPTTENIREKVSPIYNVLDILQTAQRSSERGIAKDSLSGGNISSDVPPTADTLGDAQTNLSAGSSIPTLAITFAELESRIKNLREHIALMRQARQLSLNDNPTTDRTKYPPIEDLSVMTEEKATDWVQGQDMSEETSTRTLLKYMRTGTLGYSADKFMDETYNKRPEGLRPMPAGGAS
ncbi:hypothetical protein H2200_013206 [Cladophialophora chaetospira]|uniref:Protein kinase domain-containing protein n=1 Tax=Cladophialophora chaetospira TaxID=386627 RepID=A0AA38WWC6_9EURO|nr:hypothetical protein H2200_013206 [Cladophialophora chaetospira]